MAREPGTHQDGPTGLEMDSQTTYLYLVSEGTQATCLRSQELCFSLIRDELSRVPALSTGT